MLVYAGTYQGNVVILYSDLTNLQLKTIKQVSDNSVRAIALSDDQLFVGGYDQQLKSVSKFSAVENRESKESLGVINCIRYVNENLALVGLDNGFIRFWNTESWSSRRDAKQHKKTVSDIKVDNKGVMMVSVGGREMIFWNLKTMKPLYHYRFDYQFEYVLLADNFEYLFLLGERTIRKLSTDNNNELFKIQVDSKIQCGIVFKSYLIVGTQKGEIKIWRHQNNKECIHFKAHQGRIKDIKFVCIGQCDYFITADSNGQISVWDILQFLKGVDAISQDYHLEGLKALASIQCKQRIICLEAVAVSAPKQEKNQKVAEKKKQTQRRPQKQKLQKQAQDNQQRHKPKNKKKHIKKQEILQKKKQKKGSSEKKNSK